MNSWFRFPKLLRLLTPRWAALVIALSSAASQADVPDAAASRFSGIYQIIKSTDPAFPMHARRQWFLDFGKGIHSGTLSGSVAVSVRQNPHVKVRIMAWQYFPNQAAMVLGNPYGETSRQAVAMGTWTMRPASGGFLWERSGFQTVLRQADPDDY